MGAIRRGLRVRAITLAYDQEREPPEARAEDDGRTATHRSFLSARDLHIRLYRQPRPSGLTLARQ
jgi:hypothetical protein